MSMIQKFLQTNNNPKSSLKQIARYRFFNTPNPGTFIKLGDKTASNHPGTLPKKADIGPMKDPKLVPGSEAPLAYVGKRDFPEWYRPYTLNYFGHGFLISLFAIMVWACYYQYQKVQLLQGRKSFPNYRSDHWFINKLQLRNYLQKETRENMTLPMYKYTKRYISESGF